MQSARYPESQEFLTSLLHGINIKGIMMEVVAMPIKQFRVMKRQRLKDFIFALSPTHQGNYYEMNGFIMGKECLARRLRPFMDFGGGKKGG